MDFSSIYRFDFRNICNIPIFKSMDTVFPITIYFFENSFVSF